MEGNKPVFIADASVIAKWTSLEPEYLEEALLFKDNFISGKLTLKVPGFCFAEVCNAVYWKESAIAMSFFSYLLELDIEEYQLSFNLANLAFLLMKQYTGISFYDASYHALAIKEEGTFLTADEKYFRKTHKEGYIMRLSDYGKKQ